MLYQQLASVPGAVGESEEVMQKEIVKECWLRYSMKVAFLKKKCPCSCTRSIGDMLLVVQDRLLARISNVGVQNEL